MLPMFLFLLFCHSLSQMLYSYIKILLTSGPNTQISMVLRNVLSKSHQFPINGQRDEGIITGKTAEKRKSPESGNTKAHGRSHHTVLALRVRGSDSGTP